MPEPKAQPKSATKPEPPSETEPELAPAGLTPAGETTNPAVQQLIAELATARANGAADDAEDIVHYLAELGYSAG